MAIDFRQMLNAARDKDLGRLKSLATDAAKTTRDGLLTARGKLHDGCNTAAETFATKVTDMTGRETTATEVKQAAVVAGVAVAGAALLAGMASAQPSGGAITNLAARRGTTGSGDVMDEAYQFFARNGSSLNIETQYIDQDGCILY